MTQPLKGASLPLRLPSDSGPVIKYLRSLMATNDREIVGKAKANVRAVKALLMTDEGAMLMELLEKSTTDFFLPPTADHGALDALNAQRFIALDLRRIMSDETDTLFSHQIDAEPSGRGRISRARNAK